MDTNGVIIGFPYDQLLDQDCHLSPFKKRKPGIRFPTVGFPGSGNIVICGEPGSGKSTLAMQLAVICASRNENRDISAYISLEYSQEEIYSKAMSFGWDKWLRPLVHLHRVHEHTSSKDLSDILRHVLTQPYPPVDRGNVICPTIASGVYSKNSKNWKSNEAACKEHKKRKPKEQDSIGTLKPCVLLPSLSPRPLQKERRDDLFWIRFNQLEQLLAAARILRSDLKEFNRKKGVAEGSIRHILQLVVVDSLNMLTDKKVSREQLFRLFHLFQRYKTIGIFTVETTVETPFDSTLADIVIRLTSTKENGYFVRYLEIEKSRYQHQVYGQHPFRTRKLPKTESGSVKETPPLPVKGRKPSGDKGGDLPLHGVVVFPSLHYIVSHTGKNKPDVTKRGKTGQLWAIEGLEDVLPGHLRTGSVVVIEGPKGAYKTSLAATWLVKGLLDKKSCLLIRFHDSPMLVEKKDSNGNFICDLENAPLLSKEVLKKRSKDHPWNILTYVPENSDEKPKWQNLSHEGKALIRLWWQKTDHKIRFYEVDFSGGFLLPEELIHIVRDILIRDKTINRVVLDDVSEIGATYPFLHKSTTAGEIFLPAFAHIMRNEGIGLVVSGTTGELPEANEAVNRACTVADAVISCRYCDVFGKRQVIIKGPGSTPPVIQEECTDEGWKVLDINKKHLQGLVGFDTGRIHRPGLSIHLFEENELVHGRYNLEVEVMVQAALAREPSTVLSAKPTELDTSKPTRGPEPLQLGALDMRADVSVHRFNSRESEAMHHSLQVLRSGEPLDKTVLYTVDEFWQSMAGMEQAESVFAKFDTKGILDSGDEFVVAKYNQRREEDKMITWPYYLNVLLLAYRKDVLHVSQKELYSWSLIDQATNNIRTSGRKVPPIRRHFWLDLSAYETLSCVLMDILIAGQKKSNSNNKKLIDKMLFPKNKKRLNPKQRNGVMALYNLFQKMNWEQIKVDVDKRRYYKKVLPEDSAVYVCWYSQLRELIARKQHLAQLLKVCPLPGGGFTGDWYIGIAKGSVSAELGASIIRRLCGKEEEYKRFAQGVGLPVRKSFYESKLDFYPWRRGLVRRLGEILKIYKGAYSRADIYRYERIRSQLSTVAWQLTPLSGPHSEEVSQKAPKIVERIFPQVEMLRK